MKTLVLAALLGAVLAIEPHRLNESIRPSKYEVVITPNISQKAFSGEVKIYLSVQRANLRVITLFVKDLEIASNWQLTRPDLPGLTIQRGDATEDKVAQTITFPFSSPMDLDVEYLLTVHYSGKIQDDFGLFQANFKLDESERQVFGTVMAPIYSRSLFPCFDEPQFKALVQLSVLQVPQYSVITNGLVGRKFEEEGFNNYFFPATKNVIPPHSFGFLLSNFYNLSNQETLDIWSRYDGLDDKRFALEVAETCVKAVNDFTAFSIFPLTAKIELVAMPELSAKTSDMMGLIFFRESTLLQNTDKTSSEDRQHIVQEVINKIARQWFGIVVTPIYWNDVWVSHGLAKYMESLDSSDLSLKEQFNIELQSTLREDSEESHPIVKNFENIEEVAKIVNDNLYSNKGAAIIRWIETIIGVDNFKIYLRRFITENEFKSVTSNTLMTALDEDTLGASISVIFKAWLETPGYPLVNASRTGNRLTLTQNRFFLQPSENSQRWHIPISIATNPSDFDKIVPTHLFNADTDRLELQLSGDDTFYVINNQQIGFYRVNYDPDNWNALKAALKTNLEAIHVLNRAQLVDDLFVLAEAEHLDYDFVFDILEYLQYEKAYQPWMSAFSGLRRLAQREPNQTMDYNFLFEGYTRWFIRNLYSDLGFYHKMEDNHLTKIHRSELLYFACKYGIQDCVTQANQLYKAFKEQNKQIPADHQLAVLCTVIRNGQQPEFEFVFAKYLEEDFEAQKLRYLMALTCTKLHNLVEMVLTKILTTDIHRHYKLDVFKRLLEEEPGHVDIALNYLEKNWKAWSDQVCIIKTMKTLSKSVFKETQLTTFNKIVETLKREIQLTQAEVQQLTMASNSAKYNVEWTDKRLPELHERMRKLDFLKNAQEFRARESGFIIVLFSMISFLFYRIYV